MTISKIIASIFGIVVLFVIFVTPFITLWTARHVKVDVTQDDATDLAPQSLSETIHLTLISAALKNYHDQNKGSYPQSLGDFVPRYLPSIPAADDGQTFEYQTTEHGRGYRSFARRRPAANSNALERISTEPEQAH